MLRYMLVSVIERDILIPEWFETYEEAYNKMRAEFAEMLGWEEEEIEENLEEYSDDINLTENCAWCERYGNNGDWKIFYLEDGGYWDIYTSGAA